MAGCSDQREYVYTALEQGQIRLLTLHSGSCDAPLVATLDVVPLAGLDPYSTREDMYKPFAADPKLLIAALNDKGDAESRNAAQELRRLHQLGRDLVVQAHALDDLIHVDLQMQALQEISSFVSGEVNIETQHDMFYQNLRHSITSVNQPKEVGVYGSLLGGKRFTPSDPQCLAQIVEQSHLACRLEYDVREHTVYCETLLSSYEALSYAWGTLDKDKILHMDDGIVVRITRALHDALQHLRYTHRTRRLWIDAVCIDQANTRERSQQVMMMALIYEKAIRVVAWLGKPDGISDIALASMRKPTLLDLCMDTPAGFGPLCYDSHRTPSSTEILKLHPWCFCCNPPVKLIDESDTSTPSAKELVDRDYFQRLWVVQEMAVARSVEVQCGYHHTSWKWFRALLYPNSVFLMRDLPASPLSIPPAKHVAIRAIEDAQRAYFHKVPYAANSTLGLLVSLSRRRCSNDQDRLLAIYALASLRESPRLAALSYADTSVMMFREVTLECLETDHHCYHDESPHARVWPHASMVLALAGARCKAATGPMQACIPPYGSPSTQHGAHQPDPWPSWIPNFDNLAPSVSSLMNEYVDALHVSLHDQRYKIDHMPFRFSHDRPLELSLHLAIFGYVEALPDQAMLNLTEPTENAKRGQDDLLESCDSSGERDRSIPMEEEAVPSLEDYDTWESETELLRREIERKYLPETVHYAYGVISTQDRRFIARLPTSSQIGDKVVFLGTSPFPFVLRPRSNEAYSLLGDARLFGRGHRIAQEAALEDTLTWLTIV